MSGCFMAGGGERRWGLFYGTERNDGLNCGTECFLRLKLAAYHCCTSYQCRQGCPEKLRGPGQRVKVGPFTQVVR